MRAAIFRSRGTSEVLEVAEVPDPEPGPGEVRVALEVSGVNPTDWKTRTAGEPVEDFLIPNQDGAGVIDAVGAGVDPRRIGERVWVYLASYQRRWGTAAEYTVVPSPQAVPMADCVGMDQAAGLGIPFVTAQACLLVDGPIAGRTVLVAGGAGAVGNAAIQLARLAGARVITTVSGPEKAQIAESAGADVVINYRADDVVTRTRDVAPDGVDLVVEVAFGANIGTNLEVLRPGGVIVTYASEPTGDPSVPVRRLMTANARLEFALVYTFTPERLNAAVAAVAAAANAGVLRPLPSIDFTLDQIAEAHDAVQAGAVGKVLVRLR